MFFVTYVTNAADASAIAVIVHNQNPGEGHFSMTWDDVSVPAIMVTYHAIRCRIPAAIQAGEVAIRPLRDRAESRNSG